MTQSPLSINTKPWYTKDWPSCLTFLKQLNPAVAVVAVDQIDHLNRILEAQYALTDTKIVARFIDKEHDGSMHLKPQTNSDKYIVSPTNQLNRIRAYGVNGRSAYFGNEANTKASPDDLQRLADHTIEAMDLAAGRDYDMSLTILNFGIGHPKPVDGLLPTWMYPILMKLYEHHDRHYYGLHAYLPMDVLEHLNALKATCAILRIPMPRCIITEYGFDSDGTNALNGFKSRMTAEQFAAVCVAASQTTFRPWIESGALLGLCTFIYGDAESWLNYDVESSTNKQELSTVWRDAILKAKQIGALDVTTQTAYTPDTFTSGDDYRISTPGAFINVHPTTDITSASIGKIPNDAIVTVMQEAKGQGDYFRYVKYLGATGWIAMQNGNVKFAPYIPPPNPAPTLPDVPPIVAPSVPASPIPETPQTPVKTQNNGYSPTPDQITSWKAFRDDLIASIAEYSARLALVNGILDSVQSQGVTNVQSS